jgi:hypothetical protein
MYLGAGLALAGAAIFYETTVLWSYAIGSLVVMHLRGRVRGADPAAQLP